MVTTADDVYSVLREYVADVEEPVASAVDLADRVEVSRRTVLSRLEQLEARGDVGSRKVGRARIWWPVDVLPPADPSADPSADPPEEPPAEAAPSPDLPPEDPPAEPPADPPADLEHIVDDVAREWDWDADNFHQRREASLVALQWLREDRGPASASDVKAALLERHGVPGQSPDAWWRTTVRPAFQEAVDRDLAEYQHGRHQYRWISLEN